jgi:hypothetical protein
MASMDQDGAAASEDRSKVYCLDLLIFFIISECRPFSSRIWLDWTQMTLTLVLISQKGGEDGMKQALSEEALAQEAAFWGNVKQLLMNPKKVCHS